METDNFKVFWDGEEVVDIISINMHIEDDESRIKIRTSGNQVDIYNEMRLVGITVKEVRNDR